MRRILLSAAALAALAATPVLAAPKPIARDAKVWAAAQAARAAQLDLLKEAVSLDSGTGDVAGGRKLIELLAPRLKALGMSVQVVPAEAPGLSDNLVATMTGTGKGRILLIGHADTVFEPGTAAQRPFRIDGERAYGPGVGDEKGGVVQAIFALQILRDLKFKDFATITYLIESSEERGSPGTLKLIDRLVRTHDVELNLEPGSPPDAVTVWRKGSATFNVAVKGRAAHAGVAPQDGRNAAVELIHQMGALEGFPTTGDGLTVNLTVLKAGVRHNIIPEDGLAQVNVRVRDKADFEKVESALKARAATPSVPDTTVTVSRQASFPPLPDNAQTQGLAARAQAIYAGIGLKLATAGSGGASESALAAEAGVAALDGLGPVGGGFHTDQEYIDLPTLTPRLYLLTKLIMDLGAKPPK
jgi:glutamate carboxypeptidase